MVESKLGYNSFINDISDHDIILYLVPSDSVIHPVVNGPSVVFIKDIKTGKVYCVSFQHKDVSIVVNKNTLGDDINKHHRGKRWVFDKKSFIQMIPIKNLYDINLAVYLSHAKLLESVNYETNAHKFIRRTQSKFNNLNNIIPILKHKEVFEKICKDFQSLISECVINDGFKKENEVIIETLSELESNGIHVEKDLFKNRFSSSNVYDEDLVYSQYNLYTPTGRPSNHFENVNYAALNRTDGSRACFTSRFGEAGRMVLIDYSAFHPRIISYLIKFDLDVDVDIYRYLGEMYFQRKNLTAYDIEEAKTLTFKQLYGGVEEQYERIKYFSHLKTFMFKNWNFFKKHGYVNTPIFERRLTDKHVLDPNPSKLFNYILQATETEIAITILNQINKFLKDKKSKAVLYTYDSILFDFHEEDRLIINNIVNIMKMDNKFPLKIYVGNSYNNVEQI